jgi:hypothetical protein
MSSARGAWRRGAVHAGGPLPPLGARLPLRLLDWPAVSMLDEYPQVPKPYICCTDG